MSSDPSLVRFRAVVEGALVALEARRQEVNDLNVFPVADGDTGDNMALTLRAVLEESGRLGGGPAGPRAATARRAPTATPGGAGPARPPAAPAASIEEARRDELTENLARAALLGARGNSGVILSQLIR